MTYKSIELFEDDWFAMIVMNRPERRNALSLDHMQELVHAFRTVGAGKCRGVILAANGPVFSAGHDFADMAGSNLGVLRRLLWTCAELMNTMQSIPPPAAGRLAATADRAVRAAVAGVATPGGKGGWFCHTPVVALSRNIGRKRAI